MRRKGFYCGPMQCRLDLFLKYVLFKFVSRGHSAVVHYKDMMDYMLLYFIVTFVLHAGAPHT